MEDLISAGEKESYNLKQKVTSHVIMSVLISCCSSFRETCFPFAIRVFNLLRKKVKKLKSIMATVVRRAVPADGWVQSAVQRGCWAQKPISLGSGSSGGSGFQAKVLSCFCSRFTQITRFPGRKVLCRN